MSRIVVDFPAPFGPRKPVTDPARAVNDKPSTATVDPYRLVTFTASITMAPLQSQWNSLGGAPSRAVAVQSPLPEPRPGRGYGAFVVDDAGSAVFEVIADGETTWRFDRSFLESNWTCIWGRGCLGILPDAAPELGQGCCSVGAELADEDESRLISALGATLEAEHFQYHAEAVAGGVFADEGRAATRVVDGACIFLNRPGFAGGSGCALHLAALAEGEPPRHWKPSVCWQLPLKVDWTPRPDGGEVATVRRWDRADWGPEGETMAWCCTEGDLAYRGSSPVIESLAGELEDLVGRPVAVELGRRLGRD